MLKMLVGENAPIKIDSEDVEIFELLLSEDYEMDLKKGFYYSIYLIGGNASINDKKINENDFVRVFGDELIKFSVKEKSSFFIVSSPINTSYKTYI